MEVSCLDRPATMVPEAIGLTREERVSNRTPLFGDRVEQTGRSEEWRGRG